MRFSAPDGTWYTYIGSRLRDTALLVDALHGRRDLGADGWVRLGLGRSLEHRLAHRRVDRLEIRDKPA